MPATVPLARAVALTAAATAAALAVAVAAGAFARPDGPPPEAAAVTPAGGAVALGDARGAARAPTTFSPVAGPGSTTAAVATPPAPPQAFTPPAASGPVTPSRTAPPPAVAAEHRDYIEGPGGLGASVGTYADCTGLDAVPRTVAVVDTCMSDVTYFMGHNPGVFTPLMQAGVGTVVTWWDDTGTPHPLRVVAVRTWLREAGQPPLTEPGVVAQLQTCVTPDGTVDRILDAVPA